MAALDSKSQCEFERMYWESKRSKYEQTFELMMKQYPMTVRENYQNKNLLNKDRITAKFKSIRTGFKKAADKDKKVVVVELFLRFTIFVRIFGEDRQQSQDCYLKWIRLAKTSLA